MAGPWDHFFKQLVEACPTEYATWVEKDAAFVRERNSELKIKHRYTDALLEVELNGQRALLHLEFQKAKDSDMQDRMLEYNVMASVQYELPVYSYVIYLHGEKRGSVATSPHIRHFVNGKETLRFHFGVIKLWEISAEEILAQGLHGLLPILTLMKGGKEPHIVQEMINRLAQTRNGDLLAFSHVVGGLAFTQPQEREWFYRGFFVHQEIVRESWVYQMIGEEFRAEALKQGLEQGLEQGVQQGIQQGVQQGIQQGVQQGIQQMLQEMRQGIQDVAQVRFSEIVAVVQERLETVQDASTLRKINLKVSTAQNEQEVLQFLTELSQIPHESVQQRH